MQNSQRKPAGRRSIRLREYDYSQAGEYFITICTYQRRQLLGKVVNDVMVENELGKVVRACWGNIPKHFPNVELDEFVVMPNHMHGIIVVNTVGAIHESPLRGNAINRRRMLLSRIVGWFKMNSAKQINLNRNTPGDHVWQRNYFEHIIRDDKALDRIREYIIDNPQSWYTDIENPDSGGGDEFSNWLRAQGGVRLTMSRKEA